MKENQFDRRKLLGLALLTTSTVALSTPASIIDLLKSSEGEERVKAIVYKYFEVEPSSDAVLGAFYRSLVNGKNHLEDKAFLVKHLERKDLEEKLECYVIQEFAVSTNYLHVKAGEEAVLKMRIS